MITLYESPPRIENKRAQKTRIPAEANNLQCTISNILTTSFIKFRTDQKYSLISFLSCLEFIYNLLGLIC